MRNFGAILIAAGLLWIVVAFNMDTTVQTDSLVIGSTYIPSRAVNNIGLMKDQQNHIIVAGFMILIGVVLFAAGQKNKPPSSDREMPTADGEFYSGDRDIENPKYHLYLVKKYKIEKNSTLEKYTIGDLVFDSLQEALLHASETENYLILMRQEKLAKLNQVAPAFIDLLHEKLKSK